MNVSALRSTDVRNWLLMNDILDRNNDCTVSKDITLHQTFPHLSMMC